MQTIENQIVREQKQVYVNFLYIYNSLTENLETSRKLFFQGCVTPQDLLPVSKPSGCHYSASRFLLFAKFCQINKAIAKWQNERRHFCKMKSLLSCLQIIVSQFQFLAFISQGSRPLCFLCDDRVNLVFRRRLYKQIQAHFKTPSFNTQLWLSKTDLLVLCKIILFNGYYINK